MTNEEQGLRVQLAALYRIFDHMGWTDLIGNHITVKVPGDEEHFLINPYGLHYSEVKASNLIKVDIDGNIIDETEYRINPAGMVIHSAVHAANENAHCVAHTHTDAGMAVAGLKCGLRSDNFYSAILYDRVAYHEFEGITVVDGEKERLVKSMGDKEYLILRNHGLLVTGASIPSTFLNMWLIQRACEVQVATDSTGLAKNPIAEDVLKNTAALTRKFSEAAQNTDKSLEFNAMFRMVEKKDPSFKD